MKQWDDKVLGPNWRGGYSYKDAGMIHPGWFAIPIAVFGVLAITFLFIGFAAPGMVDCPEQNSAHCVDVENPYLKESE